MYCSNCKSDFPEELKDCPVCGEKLKDYENQQPPPEPSKVFKKIAVVNNPIEANFLQGLLQENGISVLLTGNVASTVYPLNVDGMGKVRILVAENSVNDALSLIAERELNETEDICPECGAKAHIWFRYCHNCSNEISTKSILETEYKKQVFMKKIKLDATCPDCNSPIHFESKY
ncbi:DUF2007 domain-containing protein, partial [Candidatus Dependentiae bacterium]|nr:DUF2007 domain-containing protein [Candidatus Dependentiae bacterium]